MKFLTALFALNSSLAMAQNLDKLYAPAPPPNSAFVRLVNVTPLATTMLLGAKTVTAPKAGISPYVVVPQGTMVFKAGSTKSTAKVAAGKFYSAVWNGKVFKLMTDMTADDRAKALLTLYNLSSARTLNLKTADGKLSVVQGVKPGQAASRAVNGITVDLAAFEGAKAVAAFKGVSLERGNAYAIIVTDKGASLTASSTDTR